MNQSVTKNDNCVPFRMYKVYFMYLARNIGCSAMHILHYPCHTFITGNWESRILILSDRRVVWTSLTAPPRQVMGDVQYLLGYEIRENDQRRNLLGAYGRHLPRTPEPTKYIYT
jgi:hypothetical protein